MTPAAAPAPAPAPVPAPAALSGLFDGLDDVGQRDEPAPAAISDATQEAGEFLNFTLEPGATVEPTDAAGGPSPFDDDKGVAPGVPLHSVPAANAAAAVLEIPVGDVSHAPPPGAVGDVAPSSPSFAEISLDEPVPAAADPAAGDPLAGLSLDDLDIPADLPADLPEPTTGAPTPSGAPDEQDVSLEGLDIDGLDAPASAGPAPTDAAPAPTPGPAATPASTLSGRVGALAESLEEAGRIADAALLYEVQAVLSAAGR